MGDPGHRGKSTRLRPRQSGNPAGRPRKSRATETQSAFEELRQRRITVRLDGVDRELTVDEALLHQTLQNAFAGGRMAIRTILKMIEEHEAAQAPGHRRFPQLLFECVSPQSVDEALIILGIASEASDDTQPASGAVLKLEAWAVTSGLARRKGSQLSESAVSGVRAHTRHATDVVWPRDVE